MTQRDYDLRRRYGITAEEYDALLASQGGVCAICQRHPKTQRLAVDHDHKTGQVRGLICRRCNEGIGRFEWSNEVVANAIIYLENILAYRNAL